MHYCGYGREENRMTMHRGFFRGFGSRRCALLAGFTLAALNQLILNDWFSRRVENPVADGPADSDPWTASAILGFRRIT
ncbi:hypothetical protein M2284_001499 [Rhodococcus sp. LBL1]|nr:hypothetical protein [Rhodococcus sp. LBL1]MDH6682405.1 hypothetical protein [Rhodococcus sp. LBL2]